MDRMQNDGVVDLLGVRGSDRVQKKGMTYENILVCKMRKFESPKVRKSESPEHDFLTPTSDVVFG